MEACRRLERLFVFNSAADYSLNDAGNASHFIKEMKRLEKRGSGTLFLNTTYSQFTNDLFVYEGTLTAAKGLNSTTSGTLGLPLVPHTIYVGTNAILHLAANYSTGPYMTNTAISIVVDAGCLSNTTINAFGPITFKDDAKAYFGEKGGYFNDDITFDVTKNLSISKGGNVGYRNYRIGCGIQKRPAIIVPEVANNTTSNPKYDVIFNIGFSDNANPSRTSSWCKKGKGILYFNNDHARGGMTGDIEIAEGTLVVSKESYWQYSLVGNCSVERKILVHSDATMYYYGRWPLCHSSNPNQNYQDLKVTHVVSNATLRAGAGNFALNAGRLDLYNATLTYPDEPYTWGPYGGFAFCAKARFDGSDETKVYVFKALGGNGTRNGYGWHMLGYGTDSNVGTEFISGKTEMEVCDITKDGRPDVTFNACLNNIPATSNKTYTDADGNKQNVKFACGIKKTGVGTLCLAYPNNIYTGATEVVEGALWVKGGIASDVTVKDGARIGGTGSITNAPDRAVTVTIEEGGGFEVDADNADPNNYLKISNLSQLPARGNIHVFGYTGSLKDLKFNFMNVGDLGSQMNLSKWTVTVDGFTADETKNVYVVNSNGVLGLDYQVRGLIIIVK